MKIDLDAFSKRKKKAEIRNELRNEHRMNSPNKILPTRIFLIAQHFKLIVKVNHERSSCHNFCMCIVHGAFYIHVFSIDTFRAAGQYDNFGRTQIIEFRLDDGSNNIASILFRQCKTLNGIAAL